MSDWEQVQALGADREASRVVCGDLGRSAPPARTPAGRPQSGYRYLESSTRYTRKASEPTSGFTGPPSEFRRLILPRLARVTALVVMRETGLSPGYRIHLRDGGRVPTHVVGDVPTCGSLG